MYAVRRRGTGEIVAVCSRLEDARAWLNTRLQGNTYYVTPPVEL